MDAGAQTTTATRGKSQLQGKATFVTRAASPGSTSLPDIASSESVLREMQRERERLQRYFLSKERAHKQIEDLEKRGKDLLLKKEKKLAKIEDRIRKETKELKKALQEKDFTRLQKKKHVEDSVRDHVHQSEEEYHRHLEEVRAKQAERLRKQREQCETEYKQYH